MLSLASTDALSMQKINSTGDIVWSKQTINIASKYIITSFLKNYKVALFYDTM